MESPNVAHVPLNPAGALELGMHPCEACHAGWGTYGVDREGKSTSKSCHDTCEYIKKWAEKKSQEVTSVDVKKD